MFIKKHKKIVSSVVVCILFLFIGAGVYASTHSSHYANFGSWSGYKPWYYGGDSKLDIKYYYEQFGEAYFAYRIQLAVDAWNNYSRVDDGVTYNSMFYITETKDKNMADIVINSADYGATWAGYTYGNRTPKVISINEYYFLNGTMDYNDFMETISHEFGHANGLDHYDCNDELMNPKEYINTPNPQTGDVRGVDARY